MKVFSLLIPVVILCVSVSADVISVRREVARIDAMRLASESRGSDGLFNESATISVSRDANGIPRKIEVRSYRSGRQSREIIYLQSGLALFISVGEEKWSIDAKDHLKVTTLNETRFYFDKGHLVEKRVGKKVLTLNRTQKISIEEETKKRIRLCLRRYQLA